MKELDRYIRQDGTGPLRERDRYIRQDGTGPLRELDKRETIAPGARVAAGGKIRITASHPPYHVWYSVMYM